MNIAPYNLIKVNYFGVGANWLKERNQCLVWRPKTNFKPFGVVITVRTVRQLSRGHHAGQGREGVTQEEGWQGLG